MSAWTDRRHPDRDVNAGASFVDHARQAQAVERGRFDCVFVADLVIGAGGQGLSEGA